MHIQLRTPLRGLLAGLLVLIAFASFAVAITAGGSGSGTGTQAPPAQTAIQSNDARVAVVRGGDETNELHDGGGHR